ncbi:MAG: UPF0280 family protein [Methylocystaceae bacterium]
METGGHRALYRSWQRSAELAYFVARVKESDLAIAVDKIKEARLDLKQVEKQLIRLRADIETYAELVPEFIAALSPLPLTNHAPEIVKRMLLAGQQAGVGPMAAVAGTVAEMVGEDLINQGFRNVIIENGGDLFLASETERTVAVFAGSSPFTGKVGIIIRGGFPLGVCTSSGTVGPSLSFGQADASIIIAETAALADAAATAAGNLVKDVSRLETAVNFACSIPGVRGALMILGDKMAARGSVELVGL